MEVTLMRRMLVIGALGCSMLLPMLSKPALAHHGSSAFSNGLTELKGTVVEYIWRNPHVLVVWDVKGDDGKVVQWTGELASPESMMADASLTKDSLKPGDEVIMCVKAAKSGAPHSVVSTIKKADGTTVVGYSRRGGGASCSGQAASGN
jgi:hypothetical protein